MLRGFYVLRVEPIFKHVTIFAGLADSSLSLLMARARPMTVSEYGVIVREGELGNQLYLIVSGSVRICKRFGQPDEVELARLGAGDFFGEMCILETLPRAATVQSTAETTLYALPSLAFYDLFRADPEQYSILILNIARDVSRRLRRLDEIFAALH